MARKFSFIASVAALAAVVAAPVAAAADEPEADEAETETPGLIAPPSACANQTRAAAPNRVQIEAMRCMTDFARVEAGLEPLAGATAFDGSARRKAGDVLRCGEFSHFACGRDFKYWIERTGYISAPCWRVGENLAWGGGRYGTVRSIFRAWMRSAGHRVNILGDFDQIGIGVRTGTLEGESGIRVWAQHFGSQCEPAAG